ncbi:MAG: hypothetical protein M1840_005372 [Geoglossum simile]|nr:MAG: hypothetical protein M1840_005372 [Geoglossum simile]
MMRPSTLYHASKSLCLPATTHLRPTTASLRPPYARLTQLRNCGDSNLPGTGPFDVEPTDNPDLYDVMLSDVDNRMLFGEVSRELGREYLSRAPNPATPQRVFEGILYGKYRRPFVCLPVTFQQRSHYVHFIFDTGLPFTYLAVEVGGGHIRPYL